MLRYWDLGSALYTVERTLDKFTYVHQPRDLPSTTLDRENSREKGLDMFMSAHRN